MSVIIKTECQNCEDIHEEEVDGVLVLAYKKQADGSTGYPWWYHDMPVRQTIIAFVDYIGQEFEALAEGTDYEGKPDEFFMALLQKGKISLTD